MSQDIEPVAEVANRTTILARIPTHQLIQSNVTGSGLEWYRRDL